MRQAEWRSRRRVAALLLASTLAVTSGAAWAGGGKADAEFERGKKLLAKKQYAEACAAFESSDEIDPGIGVKLNAGKCFEEWGKLARAYRWYSDARQLAVEAKDKRVPQIDALLKTLDDDVPKVTVTLTAGADASAATVAIDGKAVAVELLGSPMRVDPGPHEVTWLSIGVPKSRTIALERGGEAELLLEVKAAPPTTGDGPEPGEPGAVTVGSPGHGRRIAGLVIAGAGVVGLGVAGYLTLSARGDYHDGLDDHCMGMTTSCDAEGLDITHDARSRANLATGIAIGSALVVAGGVVLYLTAPHGSAAASGEANEEAIYLSPFVSPSGGGFTVGGRY